MIEIAKLTEKDLGREVGFVYPHGEVQYGHLSSWNSLYLFVKFLGPTGEACNPEFCHFTLPGPNEHPSPEPY